MDITFTHAGRTYHNWGVDAARSAGVPASVIAVAVRAEALASARRAMDELRAQVASSAAGKLMEYLFKAQIAADPATADPDELALLEREAVASGLTNAELLSLINDRARSYRQVALLIGVLEAETKAAISAIPDEAADIEAQIAVVLKNAKVEAESEYQNALALMAGG